MDSTPDLELIDKELDSRRLRLKGYMVESVVNVAKFPYFAAQSNENLAELLKVYVMILQPTNTTPIWTSETARHNLDNLPGKPRSQSFIHSHLRVHQNYARENGGTLQCHSFNFMTTFGGRQGLCPPLVKKGDIIVLLFGREYLMF